MQGGSGETMTGRPGDQGSHGERGPPGPVIDATGREIITVKGEKVPKIAAHFFPGKYCCINYLYFV